MRRISIKEIGRNDSFLYFYNKTVVMKPESSKCLVEIARALPSEIDIDALLDEWKLLQTEHSVRISTSSSRSDHFWREMFEIKKLC